MNLFTLPGLAFWGYLIILIGIAFASARFSSQGMSEYFVGGRRMNRFVVAVSTVVSGRSAWLLLGMTGMAYTRGLSAIWAVVGYIAVEYALIFFYAPRLRRFTEARDCITIPDFFAARFHDRSGILRGLLILIILMFMTGYVSAQFVAGGKAFSAGFGSTLSTGVLFTAFFVFSYTMIGGFLAVSLSDTFQGILMLFALLALPLLAIINFGGFSETFTALASMDAALDPFAISFGAALGFVGIGLGSPGSPHILIRFMSVDDPRQLRFVAHVGTLWNVLMALGAVAIGILGKLYFTDVSMLPGADTEQLFPELARQLLHPFLFGLILAAIFAAIMSTADSQLLVAASGLVRDLYEKMFQRGDAIPQRTMVLYSRLAVTMLVVLSTALALIAEELVFWLVLFAWAGMGASIGPTSILALYWKRTTRAGVIAGLVSGTLTAILWYLTPALKGVLYELIPAFLVSLVVTVLVSLATQPPDDADDMFEEMH